MDITLLGTGSPAPVPSHVGTGIHLATDEESFLVDCGPGTVYRMVEAGINPAAIDHLLFTHHHVDHNGDFFYFLITRCTRSTDPITIAGPQPETDRLLESLHAVYEADIAYRERVYQQPTGLTEIEPTTVTDGTTIETATVHIEAAAVRHSIETYGYRITDHTTDDTVVISGDTASFDGLIELADGADILIQDSCVSPTADPSVIGSEEYVWDSYLGELPDELVRGLTDVHCTPRECGEIAAAADVDTLVLTHHLPYRDQDACKAAAASVFDGTVIIASDGLRLSSGSH